MTRNYLNLKHAFARRQEEFEPYKEVFVALVGDGTGGDPRISDDDPNHIYVRSEGRGIYPAAYNPNVAIRNDVPVYVGVSSEDPSRVEVISVADEYVDGLGAYSYLVHHHQAHEFRNPYGGDDVTWIQKQACVFFLAQPTNPTSMKVFIQRDFYLYRYSYRWWGGGYTTTLTTYLPDPNYGRYVLLSIDAETNSIRYTSGNQFPVFPPVNPADWIPDLPAAQVPVVAVYLTNTTTTIEWENLFDVRLIVGGGTEMAATAPHPLLHPISHDDTHTGTPPNEGSIIVAKEDNRWREFPIGYPYEMLTVAASGTYLEWRPFRWDFLRQAGPPGQSPYFAHDHSVGFEGGNELLEIDHLAGIFAEPVIAGNAMAYTLAANVEGFNWAADDLDTITGGQLGSLMCLTASEDVQPGSEVTIKHATGNIFLIDRQDRVWSNNKEAIWLMRVQGGWWLEVGRTSGAMPADHTHQGPGNGGILMREITRTDIDNEALLWAGSGSYLQGDRQAAWFEDSQQILGVRQFLGVHDRNPGQAIRGGSWNLPAPGYEVENTTGTSWGIIEGDPPMLLMSNVDAPTDSGIGRILITGSTMSIASINDDGSERFPEMVGLDLATGTVWLGGPVNRTLVEQDGTAKFEGLATVWDDWRVPLTAAKDRGSNVPTFGQFRNNGAGSIGAYVWWFTYQGDQANEEELFFAQQMPHSWKEGTVFYPHLHCSPETNATGTFRFGLEYTIADINDTFPTTVFSYAERFVNNEQYKHLLIDFPAITGTNLNISHMFIGRIFRNSSHANDDYPDDVAALEFDSHYEIDTVGSRQVTTK